jgi:hypothetical protein
LTATGETIDRTTGDIIITADITGESGQLEINKNLTNQGPGATLLAISGDGLSRVF